MTNKSYCDAIWYGFCAGCVFVLISAVLLPWATGMEPQEFWGW